MPAQLSFDLPGIAALGREDFFVSPANALAVAMIENTSAWPAQKLVLSGPAGSGKTHLTHVWAAQSGASIVKAQELPAGDVATLAAGNVAVEDIPRIATASEAMDALFHLHNLVLANGHALLMTGRGAPARWGLGLPDLQSRVSATQTAILEPPDDQLLGVLLAKLFADRQVTPRADVIPYLLTRMDRSFQAAQTLVDRLDRASLAAGRNLTRQFAAQVLGRAKNSP